MLPRRALVALCTALLLLAACGDDSPVAPNPPAPADPNAVIQGLARAYHSRDIGELEALVARDPARNAEFQFVTGATEVGETSWGWDVEKLTHERLFAPGDSLLGGGSIPPDFRVRSIDMAFQRITPFSETSDFYSGNGGADGRLDREVWRAFAATYRADIGLHVASDLVITSSSEQRFVVIEDRTLRPGSAGKFLLLQWEDLCHPQQHGPREEFCWRDVLKQYRPPPGPRGNPDDLFRSLAKAYETRDLGLLESLLAHDAGRNAEFTFVLADPTSTGETQWGYDTETAIHRRMFRPEDPAPGEPPVPPGLWLGECVVQLGRSTTFWERPDLYSANGGADGKLDPSAWKAMEVSCLFAPLFRTASYTYAVEDRAELIVIEDLRKHAGDPGKFQLLRWEEHCCLNCPPGDPEKGTGAARPAVEPPAIPICWGAFKKLYLPSAAPVTIDSPEAVIRALSAAYAKRNYDAFRSLLANDPDRNADYLFWLSHLTPEGKSHWGHTEEARIHRRMFEPQNNLPGEPPVPPELWLSSISISLTQSTPFQERTDLYSADHGLDGKLDSAIWKAMDARYGTDVFFETQGENNTDFQVTGEANFVVLEDRNKLGSDTGRFLLYIWEDLDGVSKPEIASSRSWGSVKALYR